MKPGAHKSRQKIRYQFFFRLLLWAPDDTSYSTCTCALIDFVNPPSVSIASAVSLKKGTKRTAPDDSYCTMIHNIPHRLVVVYCCYNYLA